MDGSLGRRRGGARSFFGGLEEGGGEQWRGSVSCERFLGLEDGIVKCLRVVMVEMEQKLKEVVLTLV